MRPEYLSASERKTLERRVLDKFKLVKTSISSEQIKQDQIRQILLEERGVLVSSKELQAQHQDLQRQRDELVEPYLQDEKNNLRVRLAELSNQKQEEMEIAHKNYSDAVSAAKLALQHAREEIDARFNATEQELKVDLESVRDKMIRQHAFEITEQLSVLKRNERQYFRCRN